MPKSITYLSTASSRRYTLTSLSVLLCLSAASHNLLAAEATIPLTVSFDLLTRKLAEQVYTKPGGIASIWRGSECRYLDLDQPNFSKRDSRLRFTTHGAGALGAEVRNVSIVLRHLCVEFSVAIMRLKVYFQAD